MLMEPLSSPMLSVMFRYYHEHRNFDYDVKQTDRNDILSFQTPKSTKVVIFVHGGGWMSGSAQLYSLIGHNLQQSGYSAVIPSYRLYPQTKCPEEMILDINSSIEFVSRAYPNQEIIIVGHSSGAHLVYQTLIRYSHKVKVILIAGVYDIPSHYEFESMRGVEDISCMERLFEDCMEDYSVTAKITSTLPQEWIFIHSKSDQTVNYSQSELAWEALADQGVSKLKLVEHKGDHTADVYNLLLGNEEGMKIFKYLDSI